MIAQLNNNQLKQLAEFTANLGVFFFATVIAPVFTSIDKVNPFMIALGLGCTVSSLVGSLLILKGVDDES